MIIDLIYVINLVRRHDKKAHMEAQLAKLKQDNDRDINYIFFEACDGSTNKCNYTISDWYDPCSGKAMTNGEVGCALSHYLIWCDIIKRVENNELTKQCKVMILEDDVVFVDDFLSKLNYYTKYHDWDMLYLHRKPLDLKNETKISTHLYKVNKSYWACAYMLSYHGAAKLIATDYCNNLIPVDEFLPIMYGCNVFGYDKTYAANDKLICYAVTPSLLSLTANAFNNSDTFHSPSLQAKHTYRFGDNKTFELIYIGPCTGYSWTRFICYCELYGIPFVAINNTELLMSDSRDSLLLSNLVKYDNNTLLLVISVDSNDQCSILPVASPKEITDKYLRLANNNTAVIVTTTFRANKSVYCGWSNNIVDMIVNKKCHNDVDSDIIVDLSSSIFLFLQSDSLITFDHKTSRAISNNIKPCLILANDPASIVILNRIENYTGNGWNEYYGYSIQASIESTPTIYLSFKLGHNSSILDIVDILNYPKDKLTIKIDSGDDSFYQSDISNFLQTDYDYYMFINSDCVLTNPNTIKELVEMNKPVIAPMIRRGTELWTNFWGDLDANGYYRRSFDYFDIVNGIKKGCWNIPYITGIYLVKRQVIIDHANIFTENIEMDVDMRFCHYLRTHDIPMYVTNKSNYGYIENELTPDYPIDKPTKITIFDISYGADWEAKYLHPQYYCNKNSLDKIEYNELCDGIYTFPLFSKDFCIEMIQLAEKYGKWSKGKDEHNDPRLGKNYYENVPTVDVQLFEMKWENQWKEIVTKYIAPVARVLYNGYKTKDINLAFVVKYKFDDQKSLAPHHDSSTYTVNIALNSGNGIDYDGGGCRFIRQNVVLKNQEPGMCCIHPGRLTAYHEGLAVTSGTRYILVSFIN